MSVYTVQREGVSQVNDYNSIIDRFNLCKSNGNVPTFIATDFIEQGDNGGPLKAIEFLRLF